ncbi:MAG: hypothetical protein AVDCRST_MAG64-626, partial [uncultured Phycisphaerae bacterium]
DAARDAIAHADVPAYGDGRLAPHEWLRTSDGRLLKTDCVGHDADHTLVGRQPVAWDVAGAMVEWGLDESSARPLLDGFRAAGGRVAPLPALSIYVAAYAAFRVGMCSMCAAMCGHDPAEQARLRTAEESYKGQLTAALSTCT